jgi:hypothetical protein
MRIRSLNTAVDANEAAMRTKRLTHVAMSVPTGTLTSEFRANVLGFYGALFGWRDLEPLSNDERLTIATGGGCYINVREQAQPAVLQYEHFGVEVESVAEVRKIASEASALGAECEPTGEPVMGVVTLRLRYLLPMAIEVQNAQPRTGVVVARNTGQS